MSFIGKFFLLVLALSFGELYFLIRVAEVINLPATFLLCVLTGVLGGALVRFQGLQTLREIQRSLRGGRLPAQDIVSGLILLVIGTLLLTPGFITDSVAFLLLVPLVRHGAARILLAYFQRRIFPPGRTRKRSDPEAVIIEVEAEEVEKAPVEP